MEDKSIGEVKQAPAGPVFVVLDVESIGLHGQAFAAGWVIVDRAGKVLDSGKAVAPITDDMGTKPNRDWVRDNCPLMPATHPHAKAVRSAFWAMWEVWQQRGAVLVADCPWPVEARFLAACVDDDPEKREFKGPYPFIDVATARAMVGLDPLGKEARLENELPVHDPLADALQSARLFLDTLDLTERRGRVSEAETPDQGELGV